MSNFLAGGASLLLSKLAFRPLVAEYFHLRQAKMEN